MRTRQVKPFSDMPSPRAVMPEVAVAKRVGSFVEVEEGFSEEHARAEAKRCLSCRGCLGCGLCAAVCQPGAIDFSQQDEEMELVVGGIVLTPGIRRSAPMLSDGLGYGKYHDVLTGPEFELVLSEQGPFGGMVLRPSDGDVPARAIFLVCDVSPPVTGAGLSESRYLSLRYAVELAGSASARVSGMEVVVLCPDLGKRKRRVASVIARHPSVQLWHGDVRSISQVDSEGMLAVEWSERGAIRRDEFEMVVLCAGLKFSPGVCRWARKLGLRLDDVVFWPAARAVEAVGQGIVLSGLKLAGDALTKGR
ncbi:MAG: hypothetical protein AB1603_02360 [Chloroflexota bacterium]